MYLGFDIGGTKCAVILADENGATLEKVRFETASPTETIDRLLQEAVLLASHASVPIRAAGFSCGGPLDTKAGLILSPPNLPGWDRVPIVSLISHALGDIPTYLENDANACALAEWQFGAGKGTRNMIFLTFGTGLGAGLILDGRLYEGANGNAGECGHLRLSAFGPVGYGKAGSFEGFCSGGGLAQIGKMLATEAIQSGKPPRFCQSPAELPSITAKALAQYAEEGDPIAIEAYRICGRQLGMGLSLLVDILNPEAIVIGSIFARSEHLLRPYMEEVLHQEALEASISVCKILPAALGEQIGDYAAIATAMNGGKER